MTTDVRYLDDFMILGRVTRALREVGVPKEERGLSTRELTRRGLIAIDRAGLRGNDWSDCVEYGLDQAPR